MQKITPHFKLFFSLVLFVLLIHSCSEEGAPDIEDPLSDVQVDPCEDVSCENGGVCINGTCNCPTGYAGEFCEIEVDPCDEINCQNGGTCVNGACQCPDGFEGPLCMDYSGLALRTEFGSEQTLEVRTKGIYAIWWSPEFDHAGDVNQMFDYLEKVREDCLNIYGLQDPPNPIAGYYYNVYIHHGQEETVLPTYWGNGQGTDTFGMPFLTLPDGAHLDYANLSHEGFHIYQYNANSPGFEYSGDSQWYVESSAQWYMAQNVPNEENTFIEAGTIYANPQLALWHSFSNEAPGDPVDWFYQVRQYGMHLLLYYLTEEANVNPTYVVDGYYANTSLLPQEYLYSRIGGDTYRSYFADWSAHNSAGFDYISQAQYDRAWYEMGAAGNPANSHPYAFDLISANATGTYSPTANLRPRGWAYSVTRIQNTSSGSYTFTLAGEATGSEGAAAHFEGRVAVKSINGQVDYYSFNMSNALSGTVTVPVNSNDQEVFVNVVSVPEHFTGNQTYNYELEVSRN